MLNWVKRLFTIEVSSGTLHTQLLKDRPMSSYTEKMVSDLHAKDQWTYDAAVSFANDNGLSVRSVISKIKSEKLGYTPKPKTKTGVKPIQKSEMVASLAASLNVHPDLLAGLSKADKASLEQLAIAIKDALSQ